MVEVVAAQRAVATGGEHLEDALGQAQDGDIERAAAQVVDGDHALGLLVQTVGHRRGGRLVEQAQHVEAGQTRGILGGLALGVVEIGRHRDHRADQVAAEGFLGALAQGAQNLGGNFHRALRPLHRIDERHVRLALDEAVGQLLSPVA